MIPTATPGTTSVGWIGADVMGSSMCRDLLAAGLRWCAGRCRAIFDAPSS
jgi:hypothetical protein